MCGVVGIIHADSHSGSKRSGPSDREAWAAYEAYRGLLTLQHRGQDAAGCLSYDPDTKKFHQEKNLGLVAQVFNQQNLEKLTGTMAIAHARYATIGSDGTGDLQPMVTGFPLGVGMAHNGNILNYHALIKELNDQHQLQFLTHNDLELLLHFWCCALVQGQALQAKRFSFEQGLRATKEVMQAVKGAYAVVGLVADEGLFGMRDPQGIRPLVLGKRLRPEGGSDYCLASESIALQFLGFELVRDIAPGEFIFINRQGEIQSAIACQPVASCKQATPCMFEWVYFAGAESTMEERSVYGTRLKLGELLARKTKALIATGKIAPDIVCPVPDTSRTAALSLAESLQLPYREGLIKNRYVQRSFILNQQAKREKAVELKLSPVASEIKGKNILLVDDSIVRGTTSKQIIQLLKRYGAKAVTLAVTCPPLRFACFYGIDFPSPGELIAQDKDPQAIADWIGAEQVIYLEESDMHEALALPSLCMACVNGKYPTGIEEAQEFTKNRNVHR